MAMEFPLPEADFFDLLPVETASFRLVRQHQINGLRGGDILRAERAPAYWAGSVSMPPLEARQASDIAARLAWLEDVGGSFYVRKPHQIGPASDPLGTALAGFSPVIEELDSAAPVRVKLAGLPSGFELQSGDLLAFDYNPGASARRALHQVVHADPATANGSSDFAHPTFMTVAPAIKPGATVGAQVQLVRPSCRAVLVPGSISYGTTKGNSTTGMAFEWRQALRG